MINTKNNEERFKQILGEFDNDKNVLSCRDISPNSHKSVWWVCPIGHSYEKGYMKDLRVQTALFAREERF